MFADAVRLESVCDRQSSGESTTHCSERSGRRWSLLRAHFQLHRAQAYSWSAMFGRSQGRGVSPETPPLYVTSLDSMTLVESAGPAPRLDLALAASDDVDEEVRAARHLAAGGAEVRGDEIGGAGRPASMAGRLRRPAPCPSGRRGARIQRRELQARRSRRSNSGATSGAASPRPNPPARSSTTRVFAVAVRSVPPLLNATGWPSRDEQPW